METTRGLSTVVLRPRRRPRLGWEWPDMDDNVEGLEFEWTVGTALMALTLFATLRLLPRLRWRISLRVLLALLVLVDHLHLSPISSTKNSRPKPPVLVDITANITKLIEQPLRMFLSAFLSPNQDHAILDSTGF